MASILPLELARELQDPATGDDDGDSGGNDDGDSGGDDSGDSGGDDDGDAGNNVQWMWLSWWRQITL